MAMLADIEATNADECLAKMAAVLNRYHAYPWPPPTWWEKYESANGDLMRPDKNADWYKEHAVSFERAQQKTRDGVVRFPFRFRAD